MEAIHSDCYYQFDLVISDCKTFDSITLVGYWAHNDGETGVDEIADFILTEYGNYLAVKMKAEKIVAMLNAQLSLHLQ